MTELTLPEKILAVHDRLTEAKIAHAFGGALALAYYAEPRTTVDIDLNVFAPINRYGEISAALEPLEVNVSVDRTSLERDEQCRLWWNETPLDLFFAYDELHQAMQRAMRRVPFGENQIPILAPEHLVVCKVIFDRAKDWLDIEQVLVCEDSLGLDEIDRWLTHAVGSEDPRKQRFDQLVADA